MAEEAPVKGKAVTKPTTVPKIESPDGTVPVTSPFPINGHTEGSYGGGGTVKCSLSGDSQAVIPDAPVDSMTGRWNTTCTTNYHGTTTLTAQYNSSDGVAGGTDSIPSLRIT
jgi:hypothetical protein